MNKQWTKRAESEFYKTIDYIRDNFGNKAAVSFLEDVNKWVEWIVENPTISPQEPMLSDCKTIYRSRVVGKHSKLVYRNTSTTVYIVDIWDMRRNPALLVSRIKKRSDNRQ